ncbi:MAG: orotidine-5'-phosphate decarboxylase [Aliiglaciecola sp.]|uniref:orotidine-5'-phosphate decarboxylase n=1 Tax=Aliiglaciecola sp. TaxID=1872441 RepID=UPI00329913D4
MSDTRVIVALDFDNRAKALNLVSQLDSDLCKLKVGKEMFTYFGPEFVKELVKRGFDVFLDLKFHDIPNTVGKACLAAADLGVWMLNVHASGGPKMMENAKNQLATLGAQQPKLIAVTVLTSMEQTQLSAIGIQDSPEQQVLRLAKLTKDCGLDGVVCSAQEAPILRNSLDKDFLLVTPGIRPLGTDNGDQKRVMTPPEAILAGVNYMVIGRPITQAADPLRALLDINLSVV